MSDHSHASTNSNNVIPITLANDKFLNLKTEKPGNTLLVTDLNKNITESDLKALFNTHGTVDRILTMNDNSQALVEFINSSVPSNLVYNSKVTPYKIGNHAIRLSFSCQTIDEYKSISKPNVGRNITKVLHFQITNAVYAITVDVLNKICSPYGKVVRIFIGKKNEQDNSIEALIEFLTDNDAKSVRDNLDGNDIYSGCCTLNLSYSKIHKIHVERNDIESYDFSVLPKAGLLGPSPPEPLTFVNNNNSSHPRYVTPIQIPYSIPTMFSPPPLYSLPYPIPPPFLYSHNMGIVPPPMPFEKKKQANLNCLHYNNDSTTQETVSGVVLFCSNLSSKIKPENLFNLFCLYGNVEKIKMGTETGSNRAYVQMSNREGAEFCMGVLNGQSIYKKSIEISVSPQYQEITDSIPNGDPSQVFYSDFYNRFKPNFSSKSKVYFPSQTLHFFNVPSTFTAEEIADVFISAKVKDPSQVVIFPRKSSSQRGSLVTGLIEFDTVEEAIEGVVMVNHTRLLLPEVSHPFHIKLSFSPARISEQHIIRSTAGDNPLQTVDSGTGEKTVLKRGSDNASIDKSSNDAGDSKSARLI